MDKLYVWLAKQKVQHPPKSVMGNAIKNWQALTRFITNTAIPPDSRISPTKHATGTCPHCLRRVIAKCGNVKVAHWAHVGGENDCDP